MRKLYTAILVIFAVVIVMCNADAQTVTPSDYLILQNIGNYESDGKGKCGKGAGSLAATGHFRQDHNDIMCRADYYHSTQDLAIDIEVTQHSGSDSDKWLLHEVDTEFRNYYGIPGSSYAVVKIDGSAVLEFGSAGWDYRWISGNKVIKISYHDSQMTKPEPLEVVKAYLAKHPSTITTMTFAILRGTENKTAWIKDEIDRRLWLCDKWFMQLQLEKVSQTDVFRAAVRSMNVFLDYREKYYGIDAAGDKNLLSGYLTANNGTAIKAKLTEYKNWWTVNKNSAISL